MENLKVDGKAVEGGRKPKLECKRERERKAKPQRQTKTEAKL